MQTVARRILTLFAGILSCLLMLMGMFAATRIDFRLSTVLSALYCALPVLSFPLYLLSLVMRKLALIQAVLAAAFLPVYYALIWRTCSELETCGSFASVFLVTLMTPRALVFLGVAICGVGAWVLDNRPAPRASSKIRREFRPKESHGED